MAISAYSTCNKQKDETEISEMWTVLTLLGNKHSTGHLTSPVAHKIKDN